MINHLKSFIKSVYQNYFEIASCLGASAIILLAVIMDNVLGLEACPMCIMTRYIFGMIAVISLIGIITNRFFIINKLLMVLSSIAGITITGKQIYLQNLSEEQISGLSMGCGMPLNVQIEYFGFFGGIANAFKGGPTCAEVNWEFIFNFAEWGFIFFIVFFIASFLKIFKP
ncbi:disulfide bond formation protein B [Gammaproteobacteria bacterium]|jgi:disulfide bond formation protein DsbB|nr:disulfide bond formation protein B [Gammaproteobacteria bacterium]MDA9173851.1 disulfide bond formation protein B [Gammaproteobacteria bacterium]MDB4848951.1 disulfide bond formation protein B [Gammaproteobacteria bacterium]MDC1074838.1 disulfide bond formation protein B [Gammaproteobacteria bacterium]